MTRPEDREREDVPLSNELDFEQWYANASFDYVANPIGSRECGLQRKAWHAALQARASLPVALPPPKCWIGIDDDKKFHLSADEDARTIAGFEWTALWDEAGVRAAIEALTKESK